MKKKEDLIKECIDILSTPKVIRWYENYLKRQEQYFTIQTLEEGIRQNLLTIKEALAFCLLIGFQWKEKFEGVP